ncbi:Dol-P-Man [Trichoderma ghanense]|uniref:Dol-P-Man n=1 Tax=Trichoderma ghanense TaxID=65468 RepID=A0ABY2GVQ7_9HYPO
MSKLSPSLKALINAPFARPGPHRIAKGAAAAAAVGDLFRGIAGEAKGFGVGARAWLAISAAATFTLNSPDALSILHNVASAERGNSQTAQVRTAEFIREVGLKCISFNGIPRTINCLNAFHASLPQSISSSLSTQPSRTLTSDNVESVKTRGRGLWDSIYAPFEDKLVDKLGTSHPDLPVVILNCHYGPLLSDPDEGEGGVKRGVGRVMTSLVAVASLRAQTGVGPQVLSHVFGLRKAVDDGSFRGDLEVKGGGEEEERLSEEGARWLAGDEGGEWVLRTVDRIVEGLGGSNFAAKL